MSTSSIQSPDCRPLKACEGDGRPLRKSRTTLGNRRSGSSKSGTEARAGSFCRAERRALGSSAARRPPVRVRAPGVAVRLRGGSVPGRSQALRASPSATPPSGPLLGPPPALAFKPTQYGAGARGACVAPAEGRRACLGGSRTPRRVQRSKGVEGR